MRDQVWAMFKVWKSIYRCPIRNLSIKSSNEATASNKGITPVSQALLCTLDSGVRHRKRLIVYITSPRNYNHKFMINCERIYKECVSVVWVHEEPFAVVSARTTTLTNPLQRAQVTCWACSCFSLNNDYTASWSTLAVEWVSRSYLIISYIFRTYRAEAFAT